MDEDERLEYFREITPEELPERAEFFTQLAPGYSPDPATEWRDWGRFRAVIHQAVWEALRRWARTFSPMPLHTARADML